MQNLDECVRKHCVMNWKLPIILSWLSQNLPLKSEWNDDVCQILSYRGPGHIFRPLQFIVHSYDLNLCALCS
jgi:hypothetical protein